jgi:CheY-like chemotaxis protein
VRVLLADDDTAVTAFVQRVLPEPRYHVEVATDGEQCLHILRTQPHGYDVLLLDLMMPGVSGYDVLREMAVTGVGAEVPVLVLTNHAEPRDEEEARLLREGLVLEVLHKGAVQDNPRSLGHVIDWHLQVEAEARSGPARTIRRVVPEMDGEPEAKAA